MVSVFPPSLASDSAFRATGMASYVASPAQYEVGDLVDVRKHGRATIIQPVVTDDRHPQYGRCLVQYHEDGTTFYCNPKKLRVLKPSCSRVIVCFRTEHYRAAAVHNVERKDVCLEVGCHSGTTTRILHNRCSHVVGVDNVRVAVEQARERLPHLRFEVADGFDVEQLRSLSPTGQFDKVFVDISGKAPLPLISRLLALYLEAFPSSRIVVKNEALYSHLEQAQQQQRAQPGTAPPPARQAQRSQHPSSHPHEGVLHNGQHAQHGTDPNTTTTSGSSSSSRASQERCCGAAHSGAQAAVEGRGESWQAAGDGASSAPPEVLGGAHCPLGGSSSSGGRGNGGSSSSAAAGGVPPPQGLSQEEEAVQLGEVLQQCELFREQYISHHLTRVQKRDKWVRGGAAGRDTEAVR